MVLQHRTSIRIIALLIVAFANGNTHAFFCLGKKDDHKRVLSIYPPVTQRYAYVPIYNPTPLPRSKYRSLPLPAYSPPPARYVYPPTR